MKERLLLAGLFAATALGLACSESSVTGASSGQGTLAVRLTDDPFWFDSVAAVNVFVVSIDARVAEADSAEADSVAAGSVGATAASMMDGDDHRGDGDRDLEHRWIVLATPDTTFNLIGLRNGVTAFLGQTAVDSGDFHAVTLIIDPSRSSFVLKDGTVLTGSASPFGRFPPGETFAIRVNLSNPVSVRRGRHTDMLIDFDLANSFVLHGSRMRDGMDFNPVVRGDGK